MKKQNENSTVARIKKTAITVIICAIPFVLLIVLTKTCIPKNYLFTWMLQHYYMLVWVAALILAWFSWYRAVYLSYALPVTIIIGEFVGNYVNDYRKSMMTHEELKRFTSSNYSVWVISFFAAIVIFEMILAARKCYKRVKQEGGSPKRILIYTVLCLAPFLIAFLITRIPGLGIDGFTLAEQLVWIFLAVGLIVQFHKPVVGLSVSFSYCSVIILRRLISGIFGLFGSHLLQSMTELRICFFEMIFFAVFVLLYQILLKKKIISDQKDK